MPNPFDPPHQQPAHAVPLRDGSIAWFVAPSFVLYFSRMFSDDTGHIIQIGLTATLIETLRDVGPIVISAAVLFCIVRSVTRQHRDYLSTRSSLALSGLLAGSYLVALHHSVCHNWLSREHIWYFGFAIGLAFTVGLVALDRRFATTS